jgi:hypothetical protein
MRGLTVENCLDVVDIGYKDVEEYKADVDRTIERMISRNERLVFAVVAEKAGVTRFTVRQYPELRNYILHRMVYYKEIGVINQKVSKAVESLQKTNRRLTFISIINKCKFNLELVNNNQYLKDKIRSVLAENQL